MKRNFDIIRYKELVEKENHLNQQNNSLIYQNREEFAELVQYGASIESQIFYQRREEYYFLISEYTKKTKTISKTLFELKFRQMEKKDSEAADIVLKDFKQLSVFSIDLESVEFSSLIQEISAICLLSQEFGSEEEGISDQKFHKSVEKTYLKMRKFLKK